MPATLALSLKGPATSGAFTPGEEKEQLVKRTDPLRTGAYSKTVTFRLSTTTP